MTRKGILLQMLLDQHGEPIETFAHVGVTNARCTFTPAGTTIMTLSPCRPSVA